MIEKLRYPSCPTDGFPLVDLHGEVICSVEHADAQIGGQRIIDARTTDGYLHLYFANGTSMPLTCPCCGGRLHLRDISHEQLSHMLSDRSVEGFRHGEWVSHDDPAKRHPIFAVQFTGEEDLPARTMQVHLDSIRRITAHRTNREIRPERA